MVDTQTVNETGCHRRKPAKRADSALWNQTAEPSIERNELFLFYNIMAKKWRCRLQFEVDILALRFGGNGRSARPDQSLPCFGGL